MKPTSNWSHEADSVCCSILSIYTLLDYLGQTDCLSRRVYKDALPWQFLSLVILQLGEKDTPLLAYILGTFISIWWA